MNHSENQSAQDHVDAAPTIADRRRFLKMAAATGIALPWCATMAPAMGPPQKADPRTLAQPQPFVPQWEIEAVRVIQTFSDSSTAPFYRYQALGSTPTAGTVPVITGTPGEIVRLRVRNSLPIQIRPTIVGGTPGPSINPGATRTFSLVIPPEGTWLLTDDTLGDAAGPMGLGAVIVSRQPSARGRGRQQRLAYDREYVMLYNNSDDRWNTAIDAGLAPDLSTYEPNYHTLNNLTFPDTTTDPNSTITCQVGERVLLRMCNLGWMRQSIHFHGYHVDIERINNQPQSIYGPKDTIPLPGHTTMEVLLVPNQPGVFPVHPHSLTTTTDNGLYIGGQITLIVAT